MAVLEFVSSPEDRGFDDFVLSVAAALRPLGYSAAMVRSLEFDIVLEKDSVPL
jgi:hypothetical protein